MALRCWLHRVNSIKPQCQQSENMSCRPKLWQHDMQTVTTRHATTVTTLIDIDMQKGHKRSSSAQPFFISSYLSRLRHPVFLYWCKEGGIRPSIPSLWHFGLSAKLNKSVLFEHSGVIEEVLRHCGGICSAHCHCGICSAHFLLPVILQRQEAVRQGQHLLRLDGLRAGALHDLHQPGHTTLVNGDQRLSCGIHHVVSVTLCGPVSLESHEHVESSPKTNMILTDQWKVVSMTLCGRVRLEHHIHVESSPKTSIQKWPMKLIVSVTICGREPLESNQHVDSSPKNTYSTTANEKLCHLWTCAPWKP